MSNKDFQFDYDEEKNRIEREKCKINIVLMGATGSGKSSLINAVFGQNIVEAGSGEPITQHLEKISIPSKGLTLWDTKGIEAGNYDETTEQLRNDIQEGFDKEFRDKADGSAPHVAWLCIKESSHRVEDREKDLLDIISEYEIPTIIVFTNTQFESGDVFVENAKKILGEKYSQIIKGYVRVNSTAYTFQGHQVKKDLGDLIVLTENCFSIGSENAKKAFLRAQVADIARRKEEMIDSARTIVHAAAVGTGVIGASPVPGSDAPLIAAAQSAMIFQLNSTFEVELDKSNATSLITGILGITGLAQIGKAVVTNLIKFIPVAGTLIGGAISATTAIALTEALGHAYIELLKYFFNDKTGIVDFPKEIDQVLDILKTILSHELVDKKVFP